MNDGQLVKWSYSWLAGCGDDKVSMERYRAQIGVITRKSIEEFNCYLVVWNDGRTTSVHQDYLEAL